jgi:hypothetical protein
MPKIRGPFEVKIAPLEASQAATQIGRMALDKKYEGELSATAQGEMLAWRSGQSGGYVAMERVEGVLGGKRGTFHLQHSSTMHAGAPQQSVQVVPGSGTGELVGLRGSMTIENAAGKHEYVFDYDVT